MKRTRLSKTVTAAVVLAGIAGMTLTGCRATSGAAAGDGGTGASSAVIAGASAASGVEAIEVHTQIAQELVQQAMPDTNPVGQARLSAAGIEHHAVLVSADKTAVSLEQMKDGLARSGQELSAARTELVCQQEAQRRLQTQWYVVWGIRIEKALWTLAIGWLVAGVGSIVLGLGNPLSFTARVGREIVSLLPAMNVFGWIGDSLSGTRSGVLTAGK